MHLLFHTERGRKDESDKEYGAGRRNTKCFQIKKKISHILHILRRGSEEKVFGEPRPTALGLCLDHDLWRSSSDLLRKARGVFVLEIKYNRPQGPRSLGMLSGPASLLPSPPCKCQQTLKKPSVVWLGVLGTSRAT